MTDFLDRLADRVNPIVVKEARQAVNSRLVAAGLLLFLVVQVLVMLLMLSTRDYRGPDTLDVRAGRDVFTFVQGILLGTCLLFIPAMTGGRLAGERSDVNVDLLFVSSLSPRQIVAGKLTTACAVALMIFSACAPFMAFAYVLRGLDIPTILLVLVTDFLAVLLGTMFALFLAAVPANRGFRIVLGVFVFIGLGYLFVMTLLLTAGLLQFELGDPERWEFWAGCGAVAALVLGFVGLLFVWSVALISPPTANRAFGVRLYTFAFWAAAGLGCAAWDVSLGTVHWVIAWGVCGSMLFALQMLIAVSERDHLGPRVTRRIPRNPLLRMSAFHLYSGAAGGLAFAVLGGVLCLVALWVWYTIAGSTTSTAWPRSWWLPFTTTGLILAYTYCYALTAALFRRLPRSSGFQPTFTWLVALVLFGLGTTLPHLLQFTLFRSESRFYTWDDAIWLHVTNPFAMVESRASWSEGHAVLVTFFLVGWAGLVTLLNAPWLLRQLADFYPPKVRPVAKPPAEVPA